MLALEVWVANPSDFLTRHRSPSAHPCPFMLTLASTPPLPLSNFPLPRLLSPSLSQSSPSPPTQASMANAYVGVCSSRHERRRRQSCQPASIFCAISSDSTSMTKRRSTRCQYPLRHTSLPRGILATADLEYQVPHYPCSLHLPPPQFPQSAVPSLLATCHPPSSPSHKLPTPSNTNISYTPRLSPQHLHLCPCPLSLSPR